MYDFLGLIPILPFTGFLILVFAGKRLSQTAVQWVGVGSVGMAALFSILIAIPFMSAPPPGHAFSQTLWQWLAVGGFSAGFSLYLDPLSLVFMLVITGVGFLIHLYSGEYMAEDADYSRFFAYMNLFVAAMLLLVLADNLLLLYLGWEGVGVCSYLLIGFWYTHPDNDAAARKAFIVTRVGDTAMAIGLFLLYYSLGTLNIQGLLDGAAQQWMSGSGLAIAAAALLLGGAVGKSAQLPLQTWLPDAMAGPTPTSALIHAATMVTAGVYLIARTHVLFALAPVVQTAVAVVGALTLLLAGFAALVQTDIKRVLAYSTISQIGYMFLGLGVGAWAAGIFHFMTHAFFKALLFMGAGAIIICLHHEQNMFKMGGLRRQLPVVYRTFLIGAAALAAFPLITAGFYSKDMILWYAWAGENGSTWLWLAGLLGALLTGLYTFRMVFITFFGTAKTNATHRPGPRITLPLTVLAVLSVIGGFVELPHTLGHLPLFSDFLSPVLPAADPEATIGTELTLQIIAAAVTLLGIYLAYLFFLKHAEWSERISRGALARTLHRFWFSGWGFDWLYEQLFIRPYKWLATVNRNDAFDRIYALLAAIALQLHALFSRTQTGKLRYYAAGIIFGAILTFYVAVML